MQHMLNAVRLQAERQAAQRATTRLGLVSSYDPNNYSVKVRIQPEDTETGWIPLLSPWVGPGWGFFAPPTIGDMIEVQFQEGDFNAGMACLRFFNDSDRPLAVPSGEFWLVHQSGTFLKLTNDGKALINGHIEIDATAPTINITVTGNVNIQAGGTATVKAVSIILQNAGAALKNLLNSAFATWAAGHVHSNGNAGANTGVPTTTPPANTQTSVVQAE